jgi:hypothetical protein
MLSLDDLEAMGRSELAALWSDLLGGAVPHKMSQAMQRRFLAYELQARRHGNLPPSLIARLTRLTQGEARQPTPTLQPGARLLRVWNGTTHVVNVVPDGFLWQGARHRSLSAIARAITGARWSGPRFFGLVALDGKDVATEQDRARARHKAERPTPSPRRESSRAPTSAARGGAA